MACHGPANIASNWATRAPTITYLHQAEREWASRFLCELYPESDRNSGEENQIWVLFVSLQITTVCNFFTYIRYIQQGLVRHDGKLDVRFLLCMFDPSTDSFDCLIFFFFSPSGTNVLGGDASSQRDGCGQARLLPHWPGLEIQKHSAESSVITQIRKSCGKMHVFDPLFVIFMLKKRSPNKGRRIYKKKMKKIEAQERFKNSTTMSLLSSSDLLL